MTWALGAEKYKAEYRRLKQMKEHGVNAIRTTIAQPVDKP